MKIKKLILPVTGIYLASAFGITAYTFKKSYGKYTISDETTIAHWDAYQNLYQREEVHFPSGKNTLIGHIYHARHPKGLIVFSHGIWSGEDEYSMLFRWFLDHDWEIFSYEYTAYNGSEGKRANGLPQAPIDLASALTFVEAHPKLSRYKRVAMGHSWGAYASAVIPALHHHVDGIVAMSGFNDPTDISISVARQLVGPLGNTMGWAVNALDYALFRKKYRLKAVDGINATKAPVLLVQGKNDQFVKFDDISIVSHIQEITNPEVETIILSDPLQSDHNDYLCSAKATAYFKKKEKAYEMQKARFPKNHVPAFVKKDFLASVDKSISNEPNDALYSQIDAFLEKHVLH